MRDPLTKRWLIVRAEDLSAEPVNEQKIVGGSEASDWFQRSAGRVGAENPQAEHRDPVFGRYAVQKPDFRQIKCESIQDGAKLLFPKEEGMDRRTGDGREEGRRPDLERHRRYRAGLGSMAPCKSSGSVARNAAEERLNSGPISAWSELELQPGGGVENDTSLRRGRRPGGQLGQGGDSVGGRCWRKESRERWLPTVA